jgi:hypothetical protein
LSEADNKLCVARGMGEWGPEQPRVPHLAPNAAPNTLGALLLSLRFMPFQLRANLRCRMGLAEQGSSQALDQLFDSDFMYLAPIK